MVRVNSRSGRARSTPKKSLMHKNTPKAKVCYFEHHVSLGARLASNHQQILGFEVSVNDSSNVQVL
jgi:hypothetical protein